MLNREIMLKLFPKSARHVDSYLPLMHGVIERCQINTPQRIAAFLSQVGHESAGFTVLVENLNYSADGLAMTWGTRFALKDSAGKYVMVKDGSRLRRMPNSDAQLLHRKPEAIANRVYSDRLGNGSETSGEGWLYRGRGLIQVTGKSNYRACSLALFADERLLATPHLLEDWQWAVASAGWYWQARGINKWADGDDFASVTKVVNGGLNGHAERLAVYREALHLLAMHP